MMSQQPPPGIEPDVLGKVNRQKPTSYARFADSPLWQLQRQYYASRSIEAWASGEVPQYATSNLTLAHMYAAMVLGYWRDVKRHDLHSHQPLYIIELGAGSGQFAYHFLTAFFAAFDALCGPEDSAVYVMTDLSARIVADWQRDPHGKLAPYIAARRLDFAVFDAGTDTSLCLQSRQAVLSPDTLELPPVVIANHIFGALPPQLFYVEKERTFEGWVAVGNTAAPDAGPIIDPALTVQYQKRRVETMSDYDTATSEAIEQYARTLPPCALLYPAAALRAIERLRQLHGRGMLLLSADRGMCEQAALAQQKEPELIRYGGFSLPVNYHAVSARLKTQGASCWTSQGSDGLAILAAAWPADNARETNWLETRLAARQALDGFALTDFLRIQRALETDAEYLSLNEMLAYLRLSHWDVRIFYLCFQYLQGELIQLDFALQAEWMDAITQVWQRHLPIGEDYDLAFDLGTLAAELHRWPVACTLFQQSLLSGGTEQHRASTCFNAGIACWQMAKHDEAAKYLGRAHDLSAPPPHAALPEAAQADTDSAPTEPDIDQQWTELHIWQSHCNQILGAASLHLPANDRPPVYATLLGPHHALAVYRFQRDPELAGATGVDCLESVAHAEEWIARQQNDGGVPLAILHPDFGLIGIAAMQSPMAALADGGSRSARFYYWIAPPLQHHGYGSQALQLLWQYARQRGIRHLFSTVSKDNGASQRSLAKLGGTRLPFGVQGAKAGHRFYVYGAQASENDLYAALDKLLLELNAAERLFPLDAGDLTLQAGR